MQETTDHPVHRVQEPARLLGPRWTRFALWGSAAVVTAAVLGRLGAVGYIPGLLSHFVPHLTLALVLATIALASVRRHEVSAVVLALTVGYGALWADLYASPPPSDPVEGTEVDLLVYNVWGPNRNTDAVVRVLRGAQADLVLLLEVRPQLAHELERASDWHAVAMAARDDNFGIGLLVPAVPDRQPTVEVQAADIVDLARGGGSPRPAVDARIRWAGGTAVLLGLHVHPPTTPAFARDRDRSLRTAAWRVRRSSEPVIVAGDLNTTPWAPTWSILMDTGLRHAAAGFGVQGTWPAMMPGPLRIPLDHVLVGPHLAVLDHEVLGAGGSDHAAIRVRLAWTARSGAESCCSQQGLPRALNTLRRPEARSPLPRLVSQRGWSPVVGR